MTPADSAVLAAPPGATTGTTRMVFATPLALKAHAGQPLGTSDWLVIDQPMIDRFAEVTGDDQWIHVDVERARRELPGGRTIAHGYLTLSLIPRLARDIWTVERKSRSLNYGSDRVRFTAPVACGARVRLRQSLASAADTKDGGIRFTFETVMEVDGSERPALVAETIVVLYP